MIETYIKIKNDPVIYNFILYLIVIYRFIWLQSIVKMSTRSRIPVGDGGAMLIADILRTNTVIRIIFSHAIVKSSILYLDT